jgi:hypothetical protein
MSRDRVIARHPNGFTLLERGGSRGWANLKLVADWHNQKRNWWFGWNGERLSKSRDAKLLREQLPTIFDWVANVLGTSRRRCSPRAYHFPPILGMGEMLRKFFNDFNGG